MYGKELNLSRDLSFRNVRFYVCVFTLIFFLIAAEGTHGIASLVKK
jgi:hypothetical protein